LEIHAGMIVKAIHSDISDINKLVNSAYRGESAKKGWTSEANILGGIRTNDLLLSEIFNDSSSTILKYSIENEIIGIVLLKENQDHIYLGMLTVDPEKQAGGIGKKLLKAAESFAADRGKRCIKMTVITLRVELINWYIRHGYENTGIIEPFPMDNPDFGIPKQDLEFVVLEKKLNTTHQ
jgi:ribosomal protein S18 acetylase RimI-like enzyme